jgi:hypothetical protein
VESSAGRRRPVVGDGYEVRRHVGRARAVGEEERKWEKGGGAATTILNWCAEVGDDRWGGATRRARAERGGGVLADWLTAPGRQRPETGGGRRRVLAARPVEQGRGKRADRWAAATVRGGVDSNRIQICSNFGRLKRCLLVLQKLEIKYDWKESEMRNNFA